MHRKIAEVEPLMNRRCPKCLGLGVEILDTQKPFAGRYTGVYVCINDACAMQTFDPNFKENSIDA